MADPYQPLLADFALDPAEQSAIEEALTQPKPWQWKPADVTVRAALKSAKKKMRDYHLERHGKNCCYCRVNLHGGGPFMTDAEHVLPKGNAAFDPYSFTMWNLSASCKRCNLEYKRIKEDFIVDKVTAALFETSANYLLIHPNFDRYEDHIERSAAQKATTNIVAYRSFGSAKADYMMEMFNLRGLQTDSFDEAQGRDVVPAESEWMLEARDLIERYRQ